MSRACAVRDGCRPRGKSSVATRSTFATLAFDKLPKNPTCQPLSQVGAAKPDIDDLVGACNVEVIEVLAHIFYHPEERVPTLSEVKSHPFFARINMSELKELRTYNPPPIVFTTAMKQLVKAAQSGKALK